MRLPRDLSGQELATIPAHRPLRVGTLAAVLTAVATHLDSDRDEILRQILGE